MLTGDAVAAEPQMGVFARWRVLLAFIGFALVIAGLQFATGAYSSDFSTDADEPAHVVSSLMVHDYLTSGMGESPMRFAQRYYVHYPKVAIGHWPPLFHTTEALWMLLFGAGRTSMLALVALIGAILSTAAYLWAKLSIQTIPALLAICALIGNPVFGSSLATVAPDLMLSLLALFAACSYAWFLETRNRRYMIAFAALTVLAIAAHGRGAILLLLPLLAPVLIDGPRRHLAASTALVAICVAIPSVALWLGHADPPSLQSIGGNASRFVRGLNWTFGLPVLAVSLVGAASAFRTRVHRSFWITLIALVLSLFLFHTLVNVPMEERFLITAVPGIALLFGLGCDRIQSSFGPARFRQSAAMAILLLAVAVPPVMSGSLRWRKPDTGFHRMVEGGSAIPNVTLIAADPVREGAFIAEVALHDRATKHFVLRGSKSLASSTWVGRDYRPRFRSAEDLRALLDNDRVQMLMVQRETPALRHIEQLQKLPAQYPDIWCSATFADAPVGIATYQRCHALPDAPVHIRIDMHDKFGTDIDAEE